MTEPHASLASLAGRDGPLRRPQIASDVPSAALVFGAGFKSTEDPRLTRRIEGAGQPAWSPDSTGLTLHGPVGRGVIRCWTGRPGLRPLPSATVLQCIQ